MSQFTTLSRGDSGPQVRSLHELLRVLGYEIPNDEFNAMEFGPKTETAIGDFQEKNLIPKNGKLNNFTFKMMADAVAEKTKDQQSPTHPEQKPEPEAPTGPKEKKQFTLFGDIFRYDDGSLNGLVVRAFDTEMGKERVIGGSFVKSDGTFLINYTSERFLRAGKDHPDLLIKIYYPQDNVIAQSSIIPNAPDNTKVVMIMLLPPGSVNMFYGPYKPD